jgi:hypothetical protein
LDLSDTEQLEYVSKPKSVICQEIGVDVLIDDSLEHAFDCSHLGIDILLYDKQGQYTWNHFKQQKQFTPTLTSTSKRLYQHFPDTTTKNIHRMTSWREILAQFPKPTSPLRYCCYYSPEQEDESDEFTSTEEEEEEEEEEHPLFDQPHYYNSSSYETVEVEEMTDDEDYPLWKESRVWV